MQTVQTINNLYENSSGALANANSLSAIATTNVFQKKRVGLSFVGSFGVIWGGLHRFPLMYEDAEGQNYMTSDERAFVMAFHEKVSINGMTLSESLNVNYMINRIMTVYGGPRYLYRYIVLTNDSFRGYPRVSNSHDIGFNINFGFLLNGKSSRKQ
jgi:hypothetical protein